MKNTRLYISALTAALIFSMSGYSASISMGMNKGAKTIQETELEERTEIEKKTSMSISIPTLEKKTLELVSTQSAGQVKQQSATQYVTYYVVNCKQSITLRPKPDVNSGEICQIPLGAAVSYIESAENGFYKINYDGKNGYALAAYLSTSKPSDGIPYAAAPAQTTTYGYETYYVVNCKQSITLRLSPDVNSGEICQIPLGSAVSYISAASNGFYYISYNGNTGYALASYLSPSYGGSYYGTCRVVNCKQSITLRPDPDVNSGEICQIPLGATVSFVGTAANDFYEIYYMGNHGYSLAAYLEFQ